MGPQMWRTSFLSVAQNASIARWINRAVDQWYNTTRLHTGTCQ